MSIEVVKVDEHYLELKTKGETYTLFSPLVEYLSEDPDVEYVTFDVGHPLLEDVTFRIKTRSGSPLDALRRAVQAIVSDLEALEKSILA
ncbi:DNA-directed RNA polymerase subunit L [Thermoproteus uzoniensis 768-20]|uniref:DNA-directed RNA polymerase subunit Rpo11 n=1 Tax=Thermoproteus uzoniensis (strain 768-20) TaxID=999630 RepID=F2L3J4_THEU7|nr:DNA-directed RNA polymerase subunit L [Thermoproteus uzoniensis 768-20]